jgi:hypothetical protein
VFRVHEVGGLTFAEAVLGAWAERVPNKQEEAVRELSPHPGTIELIDKILRSWCRAVESLNVHTVRYSVRNYPKQVDSLQMMGFRYRLAWALVGREGPTPKERAKNAEFTERWIGEGAPFDTRKLFDAQKARFRAVAQLKPRPLSVIQSVEHTATETPNGNAGKPPIKDCYLFRLRGNMWELRFGEERGNFPNRKGLRIIERLLRFPNEAVPATELQGIDCRMGIGNESAQDAVDRPTIAEIKSRLAEIDNDIDEARRDRDEAALSRLELEKEKTIAELSKSLGLGGNSRKLGPKPIVESTRIAVRQNLDRAYESLSAAQPPMTRLADHLARNILSEGHKYAYRPEVCPAWEFS